MPETFPKKLPRSTKRSRGRTSVAATPVAIRSNLPITPAVETRMRRKLARRIGHAAPLVERGTVRFEDINGPRGGVDTECRIKLVLSGRPSVNAQDRARELETAFDRAAAKVQHALARVRGKHGLAAGPRPRQARTHGPTRTAIAPPRRAGSPLERAPMKLKTARRPPSRKGVKVKARRAKHRVGIQRSKERR
jgi:ribosome-associated translation inhibitor RaiA